MNGLKKSKYPNSSVKNGRENVMLAPRVPLAKMPSTKRAHRILSEASSPERLLIVMELSVRKLALDRLEVLTGLSEDLLRVQVRWLGVNGIVCSYVREGTRLYQLTPIGHDFAEFLVQLVDAYEFEQRPSVQSAKKPIKASAKPSRISQSELERRVGLYVDDPATWLSTTNSQFGNRRPVDLIGTEEEAMVFRVLKAADQGFFA